MNEVITHKQINRLRTSGPEVGFYLIYKILSLGSWKVQAVTSLGTARFAVNWIVGRITGPGTVAHLSMTTTGSVA